MDRTLSLQVSVPKLICLVETKMNLRYRVRYTRGKTEIIIESNDKAYIDKKIKELGAAPIKAAKRVTKARPARKRKVSTKIDQHTADLARVLSAIRTANNSRDVQSKVLDKRDRVGRILACYYFAERSGQAGLTTRDVEALTGRLGNKIAQPNVGKVIRLNAKKFLSEEATTAGGGSVYKINQRGRSAFENLVRGQSLS
jgi:hypothetical protein